jgi:DeoR family fructose operon transcriptional repressor
METEGGAAVTRFAAGTSARERQLEILELARSNGRVDVTALASGMAVAPETIRRDLKLLEDHGLVRRTYGGAHPVESAGYETDLKQRETEHLPEKRRIAQEAVQHIDGAESIFIDEGFLPRLIAQALPGDHHITVVTASLPVATMLATRPACTVIMLGGRVRGRTLATVEHWVTRMLSEFVIDLAFLGANGISLTHGLTTPDPVVAEVKSAVIKNSHRVVFAGAHTKFSTSTFCRFGEVSDLDLVITDTRLAAATAQRYAAVGPTVLRV